MKDQIGKTLQICKKADVDSEFKDVKACIYFVMRQTWSAQALRYACKMIFLGYTGTLKFLPKISERWIWKQNLI